MVVWLASWGSILEQIGLVALQTSTQEGFKIFSSHRFEIKGRKWCMDVYTCGFYNGKVFKELKCLQSH